MQHGPGEELGWLAGAEDAAQYEYPDELLTEAEIPPDELDYLHPDPLDTSSRPPELAGLSEDELDQLTITVGAGAGAAGGRVPPPWPLSYRDAGLPGGPAGFLSRDGTGSGCGFADGGVLDTLRAGVPLAGFADDASTETGALDDDSLVGVLRACRRLTSWAQAREHAMVAELARRRPADGTPPAARPGEFPAKMSEFVDAEVAAALTLTRQAAETELGLALDLAGRPATWRALEAGWIDLPRATIIVTLLAPLTPEHADAIEAAILHRAPDLTTGQLRRALRDAILKTDPGALRRRRDQAEKTARVETWADPEGTATLAGRNLPPAPALAASKHLTAIATAWKKQGAHGGMDLLRAHAYLALLNGQPAALAPADLMPPGHDQHPATTGQNSQPDPSRDAPHAAGHDVAGEPATTQPAANQDDPGQNLTDQAVTNQEGIGQDEALGTGGPPGATGPQAAAGTLVPAGLRRPSGRELAPLTGTINLTVPFTTLMGLNESPGHAAGYGPLDADTARTLACTLAGHRTTRWHITITSPAGHALAVGAARGNPFHTPRGTTAARGDPQPGHGWTISVTAEPIAIGTCDHRHHEPRYKPGPELQRLVRTRTITCSGYGCGRPAAQCDLDHTLAYDSGGITCECDLAPLCRYHHRIKQAEHWKLEQTYPGIMAWLTPAGRRYITLPSHPT